MRVLFFLLFSAASSCGYASPSFFEKHAEGWHWYESLPKEVEELVQNQALP